MTRIHTYARGPQGMLTHTDIPGRTRLRDLLTLEPDEVVYRLDEDAELDIERTVEELFGQGAGQVIVHSCKKVKITVSYAGVQKVVEVKPSARIRRVLKKAVDAFEITDAEATDLVLHLPGSTDDLPVTNPVGMYIPRGTCSAALDLAHLVRSQG
ncbi:hypothetical protein [Sphaerisporangium sp. NPDC051011]|uniref:hypothetical protein n=1 Tax=Sphaerisporangium sp. NPDC051011 TaxID=3155792 RepID=UPI0033C9F16C